MAGGERPCWACLVAEHPAHVPGHTSADGRAAARPEARGGRRSPGSFAERWAGQSHCSARTEPEALARERRGLQQPPEIPTPGLKPRLPSHHSLGTGRQDAPVASLLFPVTLPPCPTIRYVPEGQAWAGPRPAIPERGEKAPERL